MLLEGDFLSKIELIFRDNMPKHLNKIKEKFPKSKFYSHSRLETFNQCKRKKRRSKADMDFKGKLLTQVWKCYILVKRNN